MDQPLQLDQKEILRYLGCQTQPPAELAQSVAECSRELLQAIRPRTVWRRFDLEGVHLAGTSFVMEGEDIRRHLADCPQVILMAATLGPDVERLLSRTQVTDLARAVILDACADAAIEAVCDQLEEELRQRWQEEGKYLTDRFSPGYGDFPLGQQPDFCRLLDTQRRIGVALSSSGIMIPRKSVTAVLGIAGTPRHRRRQGCEGCAMFQHCQMRKRGTPCGG